MSLWRFETSLNIVRTRFSLLTFALCPLFCRSNAASYHRRCCTNRLISAILYTICPQTAYHSVCCWCLHMCAARLCDRALVHRRRAALPILADFALSHALRSSYLRRALLSTTRQLCCSVKFICNRIKFGCARCPHVCVSGQISSMRSVENSSVDACDRALWIGSSWKIWV